MFDVVRGLFSAPSRLKPAVVVSVLAHVLLLAGAIVLVSAWPYTLLVIRSTNNALSELSEAGVQTRALVEKWGRLHAVRALLGLVATIAYLLAFAPQ